MYRTAWKDAGGTGAFAAGSTSSQIATALVRLTGVPASGLGSCLDYGGGQGKLSEALVSNGAGDVSAIEPFAPVKQIPSVVWCDSLSGFSESKCFDWVFMVEVIEHLLDPVGALIELRSRLNEGGAVLITTPNARGWRARLEKFNWREARNAVHINLFSPESLRICLQRAGFDSVRRVLKPVRYGPRGPSSLALGATQLLGIDGGIRFLASVR